MTEKLQVGLAERSYPIWIGSGILDRLGEALREAGFPRRLAVVTNPTVASLYAEQVERSLAASGFSFLAVAVPDGEEFKTLSTLEEVIGQLISAGLDRSSGLLALGGGVIGDLTGFAAATYLRGIPFAQVPTTLLSQVDSSVGGKTGVNHALGKNLIGAFYQPRHVHIDVDTLKTLSARDFAAGMAEVIKYGVIRDADFFDWLRREGGALRSLSPHQLVAAVKRSCQIKANIVESDEKESSLRAILNFGHTLGHAVETLAGYGTWRHGEAVAIGMLAAALLSQAQGLCSRDDVLKLLDLLLAFGLPVAPPEFPREDLLSAMARDKKVKDGTLRMVLNRGIGHCEIREITDPETALATILARWTDIQVTS